MSLNMLLVIGNLATDPELSTMPSGDDVCNFVVIHNRNWNDRNGNAHTRKTTYRCSVMGNQAAAAHDYLWKGRQIQFEGYLMANEHGYPKIWTGNDGIPRTAFNVNVQNFTFLGSSRERPAVGTQNDSVEQAFAGNGSVPAEVQEFSSDQSTNIPF